MGIGVLCILNGKQENMGRLAFSGLSLTNVNGIGGFKNKHLKLDREWMKADRLTSLSLIGVKSTFWTRNGWTDAQLYHLNKAGPGIVLCMLECQVKQTNTAKAGKIIIIIIITFCT